MALLSEAGRDAATGRVVLVGGGPGDPDLITVRGLDRLMAADVVIADRLGPVTLLDRLGPAVEIIDASRAPGRRTMSYGEIAHTMVARARAGKLVVRLKGGDPFVFAHGAEEMQSCIDAGVPVEVVPGITSSVAGPALAGIPLTATGGALGFSVVSGHIDPDDPRNRLDWGAIARTHTTIVILMGMRNLAAIAERLIAEGLPADTDARCIADVSLPTQQTVQAPLGKIAAAVRDGGLSNPAVIVIQAAGASL